MATSLKIQSVLLVLGVVILAAGLRFYHLDFEPLHADEIKQAQEVQEPLKEIIPLSFKHQQPPLDYLIGKSLVTLFPATDFWQRMPAALSGIAAVGLLALVLVRFGIPLAALIAGVMAATSPLLVHYSQYARPYALPVALVIATLAIYQHWRLGNRSWWTAILFAIVASLTVISRALMPLLALATLGLIGSVQALHANNWKANRAVRNDPLTTMLLPLVALFVWVPSFYYLRKFGKGFLASSDYDIGDRISIAVRHLIEYGSQAVEPFSLVVIAILLPTVWLVPAARRALIQTVYLWLPLLATAPLFTLAHSLTTRTDQFFHVRYLIFLPMALAIYFGISAGAVISAALQTRQPGTSRWGAWLATALFLLGTFISVRSTFKSLHEISTPDWAGVGHYMTRTAIAGDVIVVIDTRPFRVGAYNKDFRSSPRYYNGIAPHLKPDEVILNSGGPAESANRYQFVIYQPLLAEDTALPDSWSEREFHQFLAVTTSTLQSNADREQAFWQIAEYIRPDTSIMTRLAGYALSQRSPDTNHHHNWKLSLEEEAEKLGLSSLANDWLDRIDVSEQP